MTWTQIAICVGYFALCLYAPIFARNRTSYLLGFGVGNVGILCVGVLDYLGGFR